MPAALLPCILVALVGCSPPPSPPSTAASPPPSAAPPASVDESAEAFASRSAEPSASTIARGDSLVTLAYRGGHCRNGPCDRTLTIDQEGGVHQVAPDVRALGALSDEHFNEIRRQLSVTDFEALGSRPFTGECPVNFDGQELIYTFHAATGDIRLASCEVELDPGHPLLLAIESALASVPTP